MVVGTTLFKLNGDPYFSPQFNRGGNAAQFSIEVFQLAGASVAMACDVEHKNADDTSFTTLVSFASLVAATTYNAGAGGIKEQLRFKYTVSGAASTCGISFNVLAPQWKPY
jgi:hypothetical protein